MGLTTTKRFFITQDDNLQRLRSEEMPTWARGELWPQQNRWSICHLAMQLTPPTIFPGFSDHGMGWPGGWSDANPKSRGDRASAGIPVGWRVGPDQIDDALAESPPDPSGKVRINWHDPA